MASSPSPVAEQLAYYRAVADEYHEHAIDVPGEAELLAAIEAFTPDGDVLELACGSGVWTERLARTAATVTAIDAASEMLALARERVESPVVHFAQADLFTWQADRQYDAVFFGFWISHVPAEQFESFWSMVGDALGPGGRVFFCDDNHRTDAELIEGAESAIVERRLHDGTAFRVIKVPYQAGELEQRLCDLGWSIDVHATSGPFYWGTGGR